LRTAISDGVPLTVAIDTVIPEVAQNVASLDPNTGRYQSKKYRAHTLFGGVRSLPWNRIPTRLVEQPDVDLLIPLQCSHNGASPNAFSTNNAMNMKNTDLSSVPILNYKRCTEASVFQPENLLREARRQKDTQHGEIPHICILDPDGDLVDYLASEDRLVKSEYWACYHSDLYSFEVNGITVGIIPCVVGASYAVLVAEQLFVSGCDILISVTSAGIINQPATSRQFALITEAIRAEGTSYHYLPSDEPSLVPQDLYKRLKNDSDDLPWFDAKSWTTDAPYRETETAITAMKKDNVTCVEMEAAALYAFANAKDKSVVCFAHLTNTMAQQEGDFEKGDDFGSREVLDLLAKVLEKL